ncbi:MAG: HesA/MoeB/ThiF family protein [Candidatus Woesearchaeota archaeon]
MGKIIHKNNQSRNAMVLEDAYGMLQEKKIAIVGMGGTGNYLLQTLSQFPLHIHIFDADFIEIDNLERQILFSQDDIGKSKSKTAFEKLQNVIADITYTETFITEKNIKELETFDLIIDCTDNFKTREVLLTTKKTWLYTGAIRDTGSVLLITEQSKQNAEKLFINKEGESCCLVGVLSTTLAITANIAADIALRYLIQDNPETRLVRVHRSSISYVTV